MISTTSIVLMGISGLFSILLPFIFILILRRRFSIRWIPILIGAATFIIFAMVLEQISHLLVLRPGEGGEVHTLVDSPWLYVLYGVLAAGIFEETGRLTAFLLMKKKYRQVDSAISYGIGHGGIEAVIVLGLGMLNTIIFSFMINSGSSIVDTLPQATVESIVGTPAVAYALGIVERIFAIGVHLGLSVIVFAAVMKGRWRLFPLAIVLHALTNMTAAMMQAGLITSMWVMYAGFIAMTLVTLWVAYNVGIRNRRIDGDMET
ncbi:YhfC family intramembrane metalloprotease [Salinicoccus carnicancri]|uniref:YhfC family intramembrane metalloprotease n=1 Tax=Salinicoccus carnicancri TaxID=558170 RepID=UPI0002DBEDCB|nr:YhfC family glutamic-type intramembrane protease [Salinicoccus carnicancri]